MNSQSSGLKTSSALITANPIALTAIEIITDGTNDATVTVYDNNEAAAAGTVLFKGTVKGGANFGGAEWLHPVYAGKGIYVTVSGTGAAFIVYTGL